MRLSFELQWGNRAPLTKAFLWGCRDERSGLQSQLIPFSIVTLDKLTSQSCRLPVCRIDRVKLAVSMVVGRWKTLPFTKPLTQGLAYPQGRIGTGFLPFCPLPPRFFLHWQAWEQWNRQNPEEAFPLVGGCLPNTEGIWPGIFETPADTAINILGKAVCPSEGLGNFRCQANRSEQMFFMF